MFLYLWQGESVKINFHEYKLIPGNIVGYRRTAA
jgi:hypothetical protein